ncbi:SDR family NAD(P)-dependent oxidoreductase, partial [Pseudoalteromonas sp. SIMBA_148]
MSINIITKYLTHKEHIMALTGKVVLVTGAAQGIGRGIALRLAKEGADIALVDLKEEGLAKVKKEV